MRRKNTALQNFSFCCRFGADNDEVSAAGLSFVRPRPDYGGQALPPYSVSLSSYYSYSERAIAREPPL
jgi:hypothetical protein